MIAAVLFAFLALIEKLRSKRDNKKPKKTNKAN